MEQDKDFKNILLMREDKLKKFFLSNLHLIQYLLLIIVIGIGAFIRYKPIGRLIDPTIGRYITLELDSTLWLRYAKYIAEHGNLFVIDPLRNSPLGGDLTSLGTYTAYFVAHIYKILNFFIPSLTIEYVDIIYPLITTAIMSVFMFLLVKRLFDWRIGILSVLFINIIPSFLFRSLGGSSDHDILAMMFFIIALYFYVVAWQSKKISYNLIFGILSGFVTVLGYLTAGLMTFLFLIMGVYLTIELFLEKFDRRDYYVLIGWLGTIFLFLNIILKKISVVIFFNSLTTLPMFFVLFASTFYLFIFQKNIMKIKEKINFPGGLLSIIITTLFFLMVGILFFGGINFLHDKYTQLGVQLFKTFETNRWVTTVAENHKPFVTDWFSQVGKLYVFSFIVGSIFLFHEAIKNIRKAKMISLVYTLFIFSFIFSRYSGDSLLNGETIFSKMLLVGSIVVFLLIITFLFLRTFYRDKDTYNNIMVIDKKYTFIFIWFLVMILAATSAIRFLFEFTPITTVVASFFVFYLGDRALKLKKNYLKFFGIIIILFLLFNPFTIAKGIIPTYYQSSSAQASGSSPGYNSLWQLAGKWVRENTSEKSVFAHWWDYGYWVQSGFERPTITDGGNFIGWWNFLMGRYVLTGNSTTDALKFLYAHNASYVLIVSDEIGKYPAYSLIGSDENFDRLSSIPVFQLDPKSSQETRDEILLLFRGGIALDKNFVYNGKLYPAGSVGIGGFIIPIQQLNNSLVVKQPQAIFIYQNQQVNIPLNCVYFEGSKKLFENNGLNACVKIIPLFHNNQINRFGALIYLSEKVKDSFVARAYIGEEEIDGFKLVYDSEGQLPLGIYNNGLFGPIKIWEINYPKDLQLTNDEYIYFLRTEYPDRRLLSLESI